MNIQLILLLQDTILYIALRIGCFYEARVQPAIVQIFANYLANYDKPRTQSQMVKNGVEALSTTIPTYAKNKALATKI